MLSYPCNALSNITKMENKSMFKNKYEIEEYFNQMMLNTASNFL